MTQRVTFHADAVAELEAAALWYDEQRAGLGLQLLAAVDRAITHVRRWPGAGAPVSDTAADLDLRRSPVAGFPYHLVYLQAPAVIHVVAVAHDHRLPGYWRDRSS